MRVQVQVLSPALRTKDRRRCRREFWVDRLERCVLSRRTSGKLGICWFKVNQRWLWRGGCRVLAKVRGRKVNQAAGCAGTMLGLRALRSVCAWTVHGGQRKMGTCSVKGAPLALVCLALGIPQARARRARKRNASLSTPAARASSRSRRRHPLPRWIVRPSGSGYRTTPVRLSGQFRPGCASSNGSVERVGSTGRNGVRPDNKAGSSPVSGTRCRQASASSTSWSSTVSRPESPAHA